MNEKRFRITLQERRFDIEVLDDPNLPEVRVRVNGRIWPVTVENLASAAAPEPFCKLQPAGSTTESAAERESSTGEDTARQATIVKAPLPGVITAVYVQLDQPVPCGQDLCSIETMKMNNIIQAPVGGVVGRIFVVQGQAVNFDEALMELRP